MKKVKTPVKIRLKECKDGVKSIYLDIYHNGVRKYEFLHLYINPGRDARTKAENDNAMTAAAAIQAQRVKEIVNGAAGIATETDLGRKSIAEWVRIYIDERRKHGRITNYYNSFYTSLLTYEHGDVSLAKIDKEWLLNYIDYLKTAPSQLKSGKPLKPKSIVLRLSALNTSLSRAVEVGAILANPMTRLSSAERYKARQTERCYLTTEEVEKIEQVETPFTETKRAFLFACYTGLRVGDIYSLERQHIIKEYYRYYIQKIIIKPDTPAKLPMTQKAVELLGDIDGLQPHDKIFKLQHKVSVARQMAKITKQAGLTKNVTMHTGRHTFATMALTAGVDIYTVSELLVHSNINVTQIYAKIVDTKKTGAVDLIDKLSQKK